MQEVAANVFAEVEVRHIQMRESELLSVAHHVVVHKVREDSGINAITCRSCQIHVEDVEHEQAHEELLKTWHRFV